MKKYFSIFIFLFINKTIYSQNNLWPCEEKSVSSGYFSREIDYNGGDPGGPVTSDQHLGIDIAADPTTTKVLAPCDGDIILVNRLYNSLVVLFKITGQSQ